MADLKPGDVFLVYGSNIPVRLYFYMDATNKYAKNNLIIEPSWILSDYASPSCRENPYENNFISSVSFKSDGKCPQRNDIVFKCMATKLHKVLYV